MGTGTSLSPARRDIEPIPDLQKPARRNARQASVTSFASESETEGLKTRKSRRKPAKEAAVDLTVVEEVDAEIAFDKAPTTPQRIDIPLPLEQQTFRSPGAASEMSGTTAISSFSMIEAEFLEPKYMLKHMRKLCDAADEFLQHLIIKDGNISDDHHNILEMLKPGSDFAEEYHDFDEELKLHVKHFKGEGNSYINIRAVHRALFGSSNDFGALQSGINLVLYLANIVIFAKQMIGSRRSDKEIWDRLRQLDNVLPSQFMRSLELESSEPGAGDSALSQKTFELALEIRTQLAINSLQRSASESDFDPEEALDGIFLNSEALQDDIGLIRGWSVAALGGEDTTLSQELQDKVAARYNELRSFLAPKDSQSLENGDMVDLDGLSSAYPWEALILQLLDWVRHRWRELSISIEAIGGPTAVLENVKKVIAAPQPGPEEVRPATAPRDSPRKKRQLFGRNRRRSSRKFDPNAPIDFLAIDALKAKERDSGVHFKPQDPQPGDVFEEVAEEEDNVQEVTQDHVQAEPVLEETEAERTLDEQIEQIERDTWEQTWADQPQGDATLVAGEDEFEDIDAILPSGPPKNSQDILAALKSVHPTGKENRKGGRFVDRQPDAVRVDFGEGFESSQPTPGPSNKAVDKGKQRADPPPSASRKRVREESDEEDDVFESADRTARVQDRRQKAPVSKRARIEPPSSAPAPPSHQPVRASQEAPAPVNEELRVPQSRRAPPSSAPAPTIPQIQEQDEITASAPPRSTYNVQHRLALQNSALGGAGRPRQPRRTWTAEQEDAFVTYMETLGPAYARIQKVDMSPDGYGVLEEFTQVNLKDKARNMAINMIKSGTGLMTGFENIVTATSKDGRRLLESGFTW
ncbi:hypothetical protein OPT61_g2516 [Boeremia exigua]|uniref:Uncharacterized protein n=1 Tax=Boeremia exigua TaxID=749465 RepID=A0ACC2ILF9_9PLEO|nr:hypothetical protein OPT61_g2516 [Boeremia exigua]